MNLEDRLALNIGRLIIAVEQKNAANDDLMNKIGELENKITELTAKLDVTT